MKKIILAVMLLITMLTSASCSSIDKDNGLRLLSKKGMVPYELTDSEYVLLQSFGMEKNSQIISFNAPKEATKLIVSVYRLSDAEKWQETSSGGISITGDRKPVDKLAGTFALQLKDKHAIDFNINCGGIASFSSDEIMLDCDTPLTGLYFLSEFQNIEIDKEIPVALMVYSSGTVISSFCLADYFNPSKFEGMDLVQAVTLRFSEPPPVKTDLSNDHIFQ